MRTFRPRGAIQLAGIAIVTLVLGLAWPSSAKADDEPGIGASAPKASESDLGEGAPPIPTGGHGSPTGTPGFAPPKPSKGLSGEFTGGVLFEKLNEDYFVTLDLANRLTIGPVSFGVWVPLRLRVWDRDPEDDGVFRKEDWDEVSDYARLLRFVEVNLGGETWRFRGRFGELEGESIGHGTILSGYYNSIDRDHYQAGLALATAIKYGGFEFMLDNLFGPEIFGLRLHARPASFFTDNKWANKFVFGISFVTDLSAPEGIEGTRTTDELGRPIEVPIVDDKNNYVLTGTTNLSALGLDFEYTLIQNKLIDLVPYLDINFMFDDGAGAGMHLGTFFNLRIPTPVGPTLLTRIEYQVIGGGYRPRYIDSLYEVQRLQYLIDKQSVSGGPLFDFPLTKIGWLRQKDAGPHGWLGELYFDFAGWIRVGGTYEDFQGPDNSSLTLALLLPKLQVIKLGAYYTKRGFDTMDQAFDLDQALLLAFIRAQVWGPVYVAVTYSRAWYVQEDGTYETENDFSAGVGVSFSY